MRRYRRFLIPAGLALLAVIALIAMLNQNLVFFNTPTELVQGATPQADRIRLGGQVAPGTVETTADGVRFMVTDGRTAVEVIHQGAPQQLFQEGIGVVVEGTWDGNAFHSDTMLVKHDEQYRTEEGEVYVPGEEPSAGAGATP